LGGYFRDGTGAERYVHDDAIKDAVASGWKPREDITFDSPTGGTRTLTPDQVGQAYDQRVAPAYTTTDQSTLADLNEQQTLQDVHGGLGERLTAGAVSFGATDWALEGLGADTAERARANPGSRLTGEIGGSLAAALLPGGQGKLGAMLAKTPAGFASLQAGKLGKSLGSRLAARVAAEAAEGAAYGVGQGISTLALTNVPLSAEAVFSELAKGGLYGAGFGAVGGAAGHGLGKMADKFKLGREAAETAEAAAKEANPGATFGLNEVETGVFRDKFKGGFTDAEDAAVSLAKAREAVDIPVSAKDIIYSSRLSRQLLDEVDGLVEPQKIAKELAAIKSADKELGELYGDRHLFSRTGELDVKGHAVVENAPEKIPAAAKALDKKREAAMAIQRKTGLDPDAYLAKIHADQPGVSAEEAALLGGKPKPPKAGYDPHANIRALARGEVKADPARQADLLADVDVVTESGKKMNEAWGIKKARALEDGDLDRFMKMDPADAVKAAQAYSEHMGNLQKFVTKFDDGAMGAKFAAGQQKVTEALAMLKQAPETAGISGAELIAGMLAIEEIPDVDGPADEMLKLWIGNRLLRGGKSLVPKGASRGKLLSFLQDAARGTGARGGAILASQTTGTSGFMGAIARSIGATSGVKVASYLVDKVAGKASQVAQATGSHISRISRVTENLARAGSKASHAAAPLATAVLSSISFGDDPPKKGASLQESYKARMNELAAISANPLGAHQKLFDNLTSVRAVNAQLADKLEMQGMALAEAALKEAPKDPGTMIRLGESRWRPSEAQLCKWASYLRGATDPAGVYERAMAGRCTPNEAKALRELHPATFAEIQQSVAENIQQIRASSTRAQRTNLSILFGVPVESLSAKHSLDWVQQQFAERAGPDSEPVDLNAEAFKNNEPTETQKL
jgi:hypothetical protein